MKLVIIETPYRASSPTAALRNQDYLNASMLDSLRRGESPIASALTWARSGILDDGNAEERARGIEAGLAWYRVAEACVVYADLGISEGMMLGIETAEKCGLRRIYRSIP